MKKKIFILITLLTIFALALFLRLYRIDNTPLYIDETSGHYWILHQLMSSNENIINLLYQKLYWGSFTSTWLLGYTMLGVRLPAALFGALLIPSFFLFISALQKNKKLSVSLVSLLLIAFLPWSYMIGRIGYSNISIIINLIFLHLYFFIKAKHIKEYLLSLVILLIALFYYHSMVVIVPIATLYVIKIIFNESPSQVKKIITILLVIGSIFLSSLVIKRYELLSYSGRGLDLAIWRDINTPYDTDRYRALSWNSMPSIFSFNLPPEQLANKLFLNKITANLSIFTRNYLSFFSPEWLFLKGDAILRHSTGIVGAFYLFLLPFMVYGAFKFFKVADSKARNIFLIWILTSPIPAALTKDGSGYLLRVVTMLPFLTYFCALGIVESFQLLNKKLRPVYCLALILIGLYSSWSFFYGYFHVYPALSARAYEYGFKELSDFQVNHDGKTMLIVWDGYYPVNHFLFWQKISFAEYEKMKIIPIGIGETTFWQTLPNLYFVYPKQTIDVQKFIKQYQPDYLVLSDRYFVKYPEDILKLTKDQIEVVNYPDKTTAFTIYTVK